MSSSNDITPNLHENPSINLPQWKLSIYRFARTLMARHGAGRCHLARDVQHVRQRTALFLLLVLVLLVRRRRGGEEPRTARLLDTKPRSETSKP